MRRTDQIVEQLEREIREHLANVPLSRASLQSILSSLPAGDSIPAGDSTALLAMLSEIREGSNHRQILDSMLQACGSASRGCGVLVLGVQTSTFWQGPGFGLKPGETAGSRKLQVRVDDDSLIRRVATNGNGLLCGAQQLTDTETVLYRRLSVTTPQETALIPLTINGRVQAVVVADNDTGPLKDPAALAILIDNAATTIEMLPFRERIGYSRYPRIERLQQSGSDESVQDQRTGARPPQPDADRQAAAIPAPEPETAPEPRPEPAREAQPEEAEAPVQESYDAPALEESAEDVLEIDSDESSTSLAVPPYDQAESTETLEPDDSNTDDDAFEMSFEEDEGPAQGISLGGETGSTYADELEAELGDLEDVPAGISSASGMQQPEDTFDNTPDTLTPQKSEERPEAVEDTEEDVEYMPSPSELETDTGEIEIDFLDTPDFTLDSEPEAPTVDAANADLSANEIEEAPPVEEMKAGDEPEPQPDADEADDPGSGETSMDINYAMYGLSGYDLEQYEGDERKLHEKAIRFARLLVSEIKLYNEDAVKQGREAGDLYERLREDIQRSETLYRQRISADVREKSDYFRSELVRQLADGDESLLGN